MITIGRLLGGDRLLGLVDMEFHAVELQQQIVRELDIRLVDLVDQEDRRGFPLEGLPELALDDVVGDVVHPLSTELGIAQPRDRVVFVKPLLGLGGRFDVPLDQRLAERLGDLEGEDGLAGAGLALDQERALQGDRRIDRDHQILGRDVTLGPLKLHRVGVSFPLFSIVGEQAMACPRGDQEAREGISARRTP